MREWQLTIYWNDGEVTTKTGSQRIMFMLADDLKGVVKRMKLRTVINND